MSSYKYQEYYKNPKGAGDARPTALQIIHDEGQQGLLQLQSKTIFITGGSQGVGLETARALYATGADVYFTARSQEAGNEAVAHIKSTIEASGELDFVIMHLESLQSVQSAAQSFLECRSTLNILICNAAVMATPEGRTEDGFETQFGVNYLGHFYLFHLLKDALLAGGAAHPDFASRVVALSSNAHRAGSVRLHDINFESGTYDPWSAYGQSKTALIWFANHIERTFGSQTPAIHAWSVHPGGILTNLQQYIPAEVRQQWHEAAASNPILMSKEQGSATTVFAAISKELEGKGGKYLAECKIQDKYQGDGSLADTDMGYADWAYDPDNEAKLWQLSLEVLETRGFLVPNR